MIDGDYAGRYEPLESCGCGHPNARPPCSWCTSQVDDVDISHEETDTERFDRVMRELIG